MNTPVTGNLPVIWMPLRAPLVLDVKVISEPAADAPACYTATDHPRWARSQP